MIDDYGWWSFDESTDTLYRRSTGQKIVRRGRYPLDAGIELTTIEDSSWVRFDYIDQDRTFPLLVESREVRDHKGFKVPAWRVDYMNSAALWRLENQLNVEATPSYALWRRVDHCLRDGLASWPDHKLGRSTPGLRIALSGGWRNGVWSDAFYRSLPHHSQAMLPDLSPVLDPWLPPLDAAIPSAWRFVRAINAETPLLPTNRSLLTHFVGHTINPSAVIGEELMLRPYLIKADSSAILMPLDFTSRQRNTPAIRFLYVDREVACDTIRLSEDSSLRGGIGPAMWHCEFDDVLADAGRICMGAVWRNASHPIPPLLSRRLKNPLGGGIFNATMPTDRFWSQVVDSISDAWPLWKEAACLMYDNRTSEERSIILAAAGGVTIRSGLIAGIAYNEHHLQVSNSTEIDTGGKRISHYACFIDKSLESQEDVEIIPTFRRAIDNTSTCGWWVFDNQARVAARKSSEQRVSVEKVTPGPDWSTSTMRLLYSDRDVRYPVIVRKKLSNKAQVTGSWTIDYMKSAEVAAPAASGGMGYPSYGLWRRIHECIIDLLFCWCELEPLTFDMSISAFGGWVDGEWRRDLISFTGAASAQSAREYGRKAARPPANPIVERLDAEPPRWEFVDCSDDVISVLLDHVEKRPSGLLHLPSEKSLSGYERRTPFLRQMNGNAAIFPSGATGVWAETMPDYNHRAPVEPPTFRVSPLLIYADDSVFMEVRLPSRFAISPAHATAFGLRRLDDVQIAERYDASTVGRLASLREFYPIISQMQRNIMDGCLKWPGSDARIMLSQDSYEKLRDAKAPNAKIPSWQESGILLGATNSVGMSGHFFGGHFVPNCAASVVLKA